MKDKIFLTGGAGFIGSHIVESLVKDGYPVTIYDNFSSGRLINLKSVAKDITVIRGDIRDYPRLEKAMRKHRVVSHQAAQLEIFRCLKSPFEDLEINTGGTLNVLNAAVKNGVRKIINASSACVYGQAWRTPQEENHPTNPNWAYGVSKLAAEKYCRVYSERFRLPIVSLRYGIVYGEREWMGRVLTMFLRNVVIRKIPPVIFGTGRQLRDFISVADAAALHNACLKEPVIKHAEYNAATGIGTSVVELARIVAGHSQLKAKPIFENVSEGEVSRYIPGRKRIPQELQKMVLSPRRAFIDFGWVPLVSLVDGVKREMDWIARNPSFWPRAGKVKV